MNFEDEKDYIMRIIKEMARVVFSFLFGKQYEAIVQEAVEKYQVSGKKLDELLRRRIFCWTASTAGKKEMWPPRFCSISI